MRRVARRLTAEQHTTALAALQSESAARQAELHALTAEIAEREQGYEDLAQEHDRITEGRNQLAVKVAQQGAALTRMSAEMEDWQRQAADAHAAVENVNRLLSALRRPAGLGGCRYLHGRGDQRRLPAPPGLSEADG